MRLRKPPRSWPHDPAKIGHGSLAGGPFMLRKGWPHDPAKISPGWPHDPANRQAIDYDAPSSLLIIALLTDPRTRGVLIRLAYWSTRSIQDAEDLVSDAAVRTLDAEDRPWKPEERTFLMHMALLIRQMWDEHKRRSSYLRERADGGIAQEMAVSEGERADDEL